MQTSIWLFLALSSIFVAGRQFRETPQQSLNRYVDFLNQSVTEVTSRFQQIRAYQANIGSYIPNTNFPIALSPSGLLEEYYYKKALSNDGLTEAETTRLNTSAEAIWKLTSRIDSTTKALETYNRLKDYERDNFKKANELIAKLQVLLTQFSQDKAKFYQQVQRVYRRYQPYLPTNPYLYTEKEMGQVLENQQQLLDTVRYYLNKGNHSDWPVDFVQKSILADEKLLIEFGKGKLAIDYPASDMISAFRTGLQGLQALKRRAVDDYNFAARQSTQHGNEFYLSFLNHYNNDLLSWQQQFVKYSTSTRQLLNYPAYSPVFAVDVPEAAIPPAKGAKPFRDAPPIVFATTPAAAPESVATFQALTSYLDFINESLRQMNQMQLLMRNYQYSADSYRASVARGGKRNGLTYSHENYKVPVSEYQLLRINSVQIPQAYRTSINSQAEVLLGILTEMDELSIELIGYTSGNQYIQDNFQRSDAILDRYGYLFDTFDKKKEQLYRDVRRIHESFPMKKPADSWNVAGKAMLQLLDLDKDVLFGVRAFLRGETTQLPAIDSVQVKARELITNEFQNLKGLQRYGRSNGLCPYTPYEDLADHSIKLAEMVQKVKLPTFAYATNPYESFYYFFNELVHTYNKFSELAKTNVLKSISEPNITAFQRSKVQFSSASVTPITPEQPASRLTDSSTPSKQQPIANRLPATNELTTNGKTILKHDTVFIDRPTVDTVYIDRSNQPGAAASLAGFAPNNMVLLLDVSSSMDSPYKLPLLKKSIKSLVNLLRPKDQISVIVYSGKARVALKPTSGAKADEIVRVIDQLQSDGDTDGNGGIQLAYKVANKQYIRAGNNRIVLATDGEFPVSDEVFQLVSASSRQDVYLTIFTFSRKEINSQTLKKLAQLGKGTYAHITPENANLQLILEAQAKKVP
ncbi:VWA domain-containing protein [Spirosoma jeollabukense]